MDNIGYISKVARLSYEKPGKKVVQILSAKNRIIIASII
jgi:hypothetical protein